MKIRQTWSKSGANQIIPMNQCLCSCSSDDERSDSQSQGDEPCREISSEEQQEYKGKNPEGSGLLVWNLVLYQVVLKPRICFSHTINF